MSLAVIVPYQLLTPPSPPPPTPVLGVASMKTITIDFELLEESLLFGDLFKGPKRGKINTKFTEKNFPFLFFKTNYAISKKYSVMMIYLIQIQQQLVWFQEERSKRNNLM